jgi:hypothetical protein
MANSTNQMRTSPKSEGRQQIALNMFPLVDQSFQFQVYRCQASEGEEAPAKSVRRYSLPESDTAPDQEGWLKYWVSFEERDGHGAFVADSATNPHLTIAFLFHALIMAADRSGLEHIIQDGFRKRVAFVLENHKEGQSCVWLTPYRCRSAKSIGFLADFWFRKAEGQPLNREVLRLSHTLNAQYRENTDYYVSRYASLQQFLDRIYPIVFPLDSTGHQPLDIRKTLENVDSSLLATKRYIAGGTRASTSQFVAVKQDGPIEGVKGDVRICFVYQPQDKPLSHDLYRALRGDTYSQFLGMHKMFGFSLGKEHVFGLPVMGYSHEDISQAAEAIKSQASGSLVVPLVLVPWQRHDSDEFSDDYYIAKHAFLQAGLPSQFVSTKTIRNKASFKWTVSNIAMAVFAKLGGKPWKVVSEHDDCLIVGIGQSHRHDSDGNVSRYYSYCVLTDSSGLYEDVRVLGKDTNERNYLARFTESLLDIFRGHATQFKRFAIHTPFRLRFEEMTAIQEAISRFTLETQQHMTFAVLKFNANSDFIGFSTTTNARVPLESTVVPLSFQDYLVWFEGVQYHKNTVERRYSRPVHVEFIYPRYDKNFPESGLSVKEKRIYLQDSLNLSGANWRGFNAKSLPVSVFYAKLIARYFSEFERLKLEECDLDNLTPWFL